MRKKLYAFVMISALLGITAINMGCSLDALVAAAAKDAVKKNLTTASGSVK